MEYRVIKQDESLSHHGIRGQRWGVRRFQNPDGTLTPEGERRYLSKGAKKLAGAGIKLGVANAAMNVGEAIANNPIGTSAKVIGAVTKAGNTVGKVAAQLSGQSTLQSVMAGADSAAKWAATATPAVANFMSQYGGLATTALTGLGWVSAGLAAVSAVSAIASVSKVAYSTYKEYKNEKNSQNNQQKKK